MERTLEAFHGHAANVDEALTGRLSIWRASLHMAAAHPVNGVGVRSFRYAYPSYAPANDHFVTDESCGVGEGACHAHQLLLEILTETGALGLVLWFAASCVATRHWWTRPPPARRRAFPVTVALAAMLFPINTHLAFYSAWWGLLFAWLLALWCAALYADITDMPDEGDA
jgi:O-antigen ligase